MPDLSHHYVTRNNWLRAAVMGANDGIISTASLLAGVAAAGVSSSVLFLTGVSGIVAGALSMAAGEYVSVSSQADMEQADIDREAEALENNFALESEELVALYQSRGLSESLANEVAQQLMATAALETHAREELGIHEHNQAKPIQAAFASGAAFTAGAVIPFAAAVLVSSQAVLISIGISTLISLTLLGYLSAKSGGAPVKKAILRILFWGGAALLCGSVVGSLLNTG